MKYKQKTIEICNYPVRNISQCNINKNELDKFLWEWSDEKITLAKLNIPVPIYSLSSFEKISAMSITSGFDKRGFCLIKVLIFKDPDVEGDTLKRYEVTAMIDTGASHTVISDNIVEILQLNKKDCRSVLRGFDDSPMKECATACIMIPEVLGDATFCPYFPIKNGLGETGFDIIIGNDFLMQMKFERNGTIGTFTLSAE